MNWFKDSKTYSSEKSGKIVCSRIFGTYVISISGSSQSSFYTRFLWGSAFDSMKQKSKIKNVLLLGYGDGSFVKLLHRKFKRAQVTVIERDPVIIEIADAIKSYKKGGRPEVIIGDVSHVLPKMDKTFDLIIINLLETEFFNDLPSILKPKGYLLIKSSGKKELSPVYDNMFSHHDSLGFAKSEVVLYRHFGLGRAGDPLPPGYVPRFECWEYVQRNLPSKEFLKGFESIKNSAIGVRWFNGLFIVEKYRTDLLPTIAPLNKWRVALWYPFTSMQKPEGWHEDWTHIGTRQTGIAILNPNDYQADWNENIKRQLKKWKKQDKYEIVAGTPEELEAGIVSRRNKSINGIIKSAFAPMVYDQLRNHGDLLKIWLVKDKVSGEAVAGLGVIDIPETKTSLHFLAFNFKDVDNLGGGAAMIDLWYRESLNKGFEFLDFDLVWTLGDPFAWRGYSRFKKQFGLYLIKYPGNYFKILPPEKK